MVVWYLMLWEAKNDEKDFQKIGLVSFFERVCA